MSSCRTTLADADFAHRKSSIIITDQQVFQRKRPRPPEAGNSPAAAVHIKQWFNKEKIQPFPRALGSQTGTGLRKVGEPEDLSQIVDEPEPDIMPGVSIFGPGIAQADYNLKAGFRSVLYCSSVSFLRLITSGSADSSSTASTTSAASSTGSLVITGGTTVTTVW